MHVLKTLQDLVEINASDFFVEGTKPFYEILKTATGHILQENIYSLLFGVPFRGLELHNVWMVEFLKNLDFFN